MKGKNKNVESKKLENTIKRLNITINELGKNTNKANESSEKLVSTIKELDKDTRRGNKIIIGLTLMLLALGLIEAAIIFSIRNNLFIIVIAFILFWLIGGFLMIIEGVTWLWDWIKKIK
jgi:hypothetical protein